VPLTPLVDVVFILLVFFMLASSFLDWRVRPVAVAGPAAGSVSEGAVLDLLAGQGVAALSVIRD